MSSIPRLRVGGVWLDASRGTDREAITDVLRDEGRVRALAHDGQVGLLVALLGELDREQQASILEITDTVWDLVTCGVAKEVAALVAAMSVPQRTVVLGSARAVTALVREHRRAVWSWLRELPPASQAAVLLAHDAVAALIVDRESASNVIGMVERMNPPDQVDVLSRTDVVDCLVNREQSPRVLSLLAPHSGAELARILSRCRALPQLAAEGRVAQLAELMTTMTRVQRFRVLVWDNALLAFTQNGRRTQVMEWLATLDAQEQQELSNLIPRLLNRLTDPPPREELRHRVVAAIEWLEAQPVPGCFSITDHATWEALRAPVEGLPPLRVATALRKLTLAQRVRLLWLSNAVFLLARGAGEATAQLIAELPQGDQFEILRQPSALDVLVAEGAGSLVSRMLHAFPANARARLLGEVSGDWKESLWPPHEFARELALLLGELDAERQFQLVEQDGHAALMVAHGYGALVTALLDTCPPEQRVQLLQARGLVAALLQVEGIAVVAARFESLPPAGRAALLTNPPFMNECVEQGLAPTLFHLLETLSGTELDQALDPAHEFTDRRAGPLLKQWRDWLAHPNERLTLRSSSR